MRLLLDTHALIWAIADPGRLSEAASTAVTNPTNHVLVSVASAWEISIKRSLGKLDFTEIETELLDRYRFELAPITLQHTAALAALPHLHRDPFDRMLVAQAHCDGLIIVSRDPQIARYRVETLW